MEAPKHPERIWSPADAALEAQRKKIVTPLPVILSRMKLEPGEVLLIAVAPESMGSVMQIKELVEQLFGKDNERVLIYERGQLDFIVAPGKGLL